MSAKKGTYAKAIKGLEKTAKTGSYYWKEKAKSTLYAVKTLKLSLSQDEIALWSQKA